MKGIWHLLCSLHYTFGMMRLFPVSLLPIIDTINQSHETMLTILINNTCENLDIPLQINSRSCHMKQFSQPIKFYTTVSVCLLAESFSSITFDSTLVCWEEFSKNFIVYKNMLPWLLYIKTLYYIFTSYSLIDHWYKKKIVFTLSIIPIMFCIAHSVQDWTITLFSWWDAHHNGTALRKSLFIHGPAPFVDPIIFPML